MINLSSDIGGLKRSLVDLREQRVELGSEAEARNYDAQIGDDEDGLMQEEADTLDVIVSDLDETIAYIETKISKLEGSLDNVVLPLGAIVKMNYHA